MLDGRQFGKRKNDLNPDTFKFNKHSLAKVSFNVTESFDLVRVWFIEYVYYNRNSNAKY
jgi:hypothetical protein